MIDHPFPGDVEANFFASRFDEAGAVLRILEVGAHDAPITHWLAQKGHKTYSLDLRPYDGPVHECHVRHVIGDFCELPDAVNREFIGLFDVIVSVSALEHFGLGTYGEGAAHPYLDVIAARKAYEYLRPGGRFYVSVPVGGRYVSHHPHWRVYSWDALMERIVQDFDVAWFQACVAESLVLNGRAYESGTMATWEAMLMNVHGAPGISGLLKLIKNPEKRRAVR